MVRMQDEIEPLPGIADGERVNRIDKQVVVEEEGGHRRDEGREATPHKGDRRDRQDVDRRCVRHPEGTLDGRDGDSRARERQAADEHGSSEFTRADTGHPPRLLRHLVRLIARWPSAAGAPAIGQAEATS